MDDDVAVLAAVRRILTRYGYDVTAVASAADAIAQYDRRPVDLLLTDVRMPEMDGPALVAQLTAKHPDLRVLYMSGYTDGRLEGALTPGQRAFIAKPFTVEQLTIQIAALID
ncbi:MAG: response regulator [Gemmatimonadaceae bacterium]|nr:response regulator [Gemmatimonadaceae bacterium]